MTTHVEFAGAAGILEGALDEPGTPARAIAVLCHPHPLHGGSLDDAVLATAATAMLNAGIACLRFNFRGVGGSAGEHDNGRGETDDAVAALTYCAAARPQLPRLLLGYSFGATVAWRAAQPATGAGPLSRLLLIAPVMGRSPFAGVAPACPIHVVAGADDHFISWPTLTAWSQRFQPPPTLARIELADHFFSGCSSALAKAVAAALAEPG